MKRMSMLLICFISTAVLAKATDLSTASSEDLLAIYTQLRAIQGGTKAATAEDVRFKRDSATFTFVTGRITFAAPISGRVLAARFEGEGIFELDPPSSVDKRQLARFAKNPKLTDTFSEAVFYFSDDTFSEMEKLLNVQTIPNPDPELFSSSQNRFIENFNDWIDNRRKGFPAMRNMAARMLADITDNSSKGFFLAEFKAKESGELLFHISWNRDSILLPSYPKGEEVTLLHLNRGNYYEWWAGFHLTSEYARLPKPDHHTLLVHCPAAQIDLDVVKDNKISAAAYLEFVVREGAPRVLPFFLNGVLRISSIEDGAGNPVSFIQEKRNRDSDPWLILAEPAEAGKKYKIKISYKEESTRDSRLIQQRASGPFYVVYPSRNSWFPSFGAADDRTMFEINARSPKKFQFYSLGKPIKSERDKKTQITSWKSTIPFSTVGFIYGDFFEENRTSADLNVTAYSGRNVTYEGRATAINGPIVNSIDTPFSRTRGSPTAWRTGFNTDVSAKNAIAMSFPVFQFFEYLFGALPFKDLSVTEQTIIDGGQSWPSQVLVPYPAILDSTSRNALGLMQSPEDRDFIRTVAPREIAHQWWGHLVGWRTYHDQWLPEAIADFASMMFLRQYEPREAADFWKFRRFLLFQKNSLGYRPVDAGPVWLNLQLNEYNAWNNSKIIRYKGVYIIEMLRMLMFDPKLRDPNSRFISMMKEFITLFAGKNASTEDFRRIVDKHNGKSMEWFFNQWVYGIDIPTYEFSYDLKEAGDGETEVIINLKQSGVSDSFYMQLPIYLVVDKEGLHYGLVGITGNKSLKTSFTVSVRPEKVLLDPERSILAEIHQ